MNGEQRGKPIPCSGIKIQANDDDERVFVLYVCLLLHVSTYLYAYSVINLGINTLVTLTIKIRVKLMLQEIC